MRPAPAAALILFTNAAAAEPASLSAQAIRDLVPGAVVEIDTPIGSKVPIRYAGDGRITGHKRNAVRRPVTELRW